MEVYLDSQESLREIFIDLKIVKQILNQAVLNVVGIWRRNANVCVAKSLEKWKFVASDDCGASVWMSIVKVNVKKIYAMIKAARISDLAFHIRKWKEFTDECREEERNKELNADIECGYQNEIKQIEIHINDLQLKNDDLSKVHAHFAEREMIYCKKLNELNAVKIKRIETEKIEEKIQFLQDENYELEIKVHAAEFCLKNFLSSTKSSIHPNPTAQISPIII